MESKMSFSHHILSQCVNKGMKPIMKEIKIWKSLQIIRKDSTSFFLLVT